MAAAAATAAVGDYNYTYYQLLTSKVLPLFFLFFLSSRVRRIVLLGGAER